MLEVKPIYDVLSHSCLDAIVISLASYQVLDYEPMFYDSWNFIYDTRLGTKIGDRLHEGEDRSWINIKEYAGLEIIEYGRNDELEKTIDEELFTRNIPILLYIDAYYCPWTKVYQKESYTHTCLLIGKQGGETYMSIDPYTNLKYNPIPLEEIRKGCTGYAVFRKMEPQKTLSCDQLLRHQINIMSEKINGNNKIEMMKLFANDIEQHFHLNDELNGNENLLKAMLFERLKFLSRRRRQFSALLRYMNRTYGMPLMLQLAEKFDDAASKWETVRNTMIKLCFSENMDDLRIRAQKRILAASEQESEILDIIKSMLK